MGFDDHVRHPPAIFPPIQPFASGYLDVGDQHRVWWETAGNPNGKPVLFLHGGPGGGFHADHRRLFDPDHYLIVLFDQRGCGRSLPHGELQANTTQHLISDIELLRDCLGIQRWLLLGGSWGATLALAYAQAHPQSVTGLILRGVFTGRQCEVDWLYKFGASQVFPDALWNCMKTAVWKRRIRGSAPLRARHARATFAAVAAGRTRGNDRWRI